MLQIEKLNSLRSIQIHVVYWSLPGIKFSIQRTPLKWIRPQVWNPPLETHGKPSETIGYTFKWEGCLVHKRQENSTYNSWTMSFITEHWGIDENRIRSLRLQTPLEVHIFQIRVTIGVERALEKNMLKGRVSEVTQFEINGYAQNQCLTLANQWRPNHRGHTSHRDWTLNSATDVAIRI